MYLLGAATKQLSSLGHLTRLWKITKRFLAGDLLDSADRPHKKRDSFQLGRLKYIISYRG
jgi:hypothetical protein